MANQISIFDIAFPKFTLDRPIRLIELFAGYGEQRKSRNVEMGKSM